MVPGLRVVHPGHGWESTKNRAHEPRGAWAGGGRAPWGSCPADAPGRGRLRAGLRQQDTIVPSVYRLRAVLRDVGLPIWRRLPVRSDTGLGALRGALQAATGWSDACLRRFRIHGKAYGIARCGGIGCAGDPFRLRLLGRPGASKVPALRLARLAVARAPGFSCSRGPFSPGLAALAAPVRGGGLGAQAEREPDRASTSGAAGLIPYYP